MENEGIELLIEDQKEEKEQNFQWLVCMKCNVEIPSSAVFINSRGEAEIFLSCKCGHKEVSTISKYIKYSPQVKGGECDACEKDSDSVLYCVECQKWFCDKCQNIHNQYAYHNFFADKLVLSPRCQIHDKNLIYFCKECNIELCHDCKLDKKHSGHKLKIIKVKKMYEEFEKGFNLEEFEKNLEEKNNNNEIIKKEFFESVDNKIKELNGLKADIEKEYQKNKEMNETLIQFVSTLHTNYIQSKENDHHLYNLLHNLQINTDINNEEFVENEKDNVEKYFIDVKSFYKTNFIIKFRYLPIYQKVLELYEKDLNASALYQEEESKEMDSKNRINLKDGENSKKPKIRNILKIEEDDGKYKGIFAVSIGKEIKFWNLNTGKIEAMFNEHEKPIRTLIKLPNERLASCSWDCTIRIWNLKKYQGLYKTLKGHNALVTDIKTYQQFFLCSASLDYTVKIWEIMTKFQCVKTIVSGGPVLSLLEFDDKKLIYASKNEIIMETENAWFLANKTTKVHDDIVSTILKYGNEKIITGSYDKKVRVWKLKNFERENELKFSGKIISLSYLNENTLCVEMKDDLNQNKLQFVNLESMTIINPTNVANSNLSKIVLFNSMIGLSSEENKIYVWRMISKDMSVFDDIIFC